MRLILALLVAALWDAESAAADNVATTVPSVVKLDFAKARDVQVPARSRRLRARDSFTASLINNVTAGSYLISTTVGTPGQAINLVIDTGSSDVFVLSNTANQCTNRRLEYENGPCVGGTYDGADSSSYHLINHDFDISFADGSGSSGDYFSDSIALGGQTIKSQQLGLALKTTVGTGIMGIGFAANEATSDKYSSLVQSMVSQGLIASQVYSLYLDDLKSSTGSIIFGGVDSAKYRPPLIALPLQPDSSSHTVDSFTVALSGVSGTGSSGNTTSFTADSFVLPVVLDSGTTITYLDDATTGAIYDAFGVLQDSAGDALIDCALKQSSASISFAFGGAGGPVIKVGLDQLIFDVDSGGFGPTSDSPFGSTCAFGIQSGSGPDLFLLGDSFLRSAYVVYDLDNNEVALAQTDFEASTSSVVAVPAKAESIPGVSRTASAATVAASAVRPGTGRATTLLIINGATVTAGAASTSKAAAHHVGPPAPLTGVSAVAAVVAAAFLAGALLLA
jgi:hypothetical protein